MNDDVGKLVLRLALGILVLFHGIAKLKGGIGFLGPMVTGMGLPAWFSYGIYLGEVLGPIMVILGVFTRIGAFFILANMIFAILLVHTGDLMRFGKEGGWALELQGMFLFTALAIMLMSPGRYAVTRRF